MRNQRYFRRSHDGHFYSSSREISTPRGWPYIINIASTRGLLTLSASGRILPCSIYAYSTSKAAVNLLSIDYARNWEGKVRINSVCPGHCSTNLNGYRGYKSTEDGAKVVLQVAAVLSIRRDRSIPWRYFRHDQDKHNIMGFFPNITLNGFQKFSRKQL